MKVCTIERKKERAKKDLVFTVVLPGSVSFLSFPTSERVFNYLKLPNIYYSGLPYQRKFKNLCKILWGLFDQKTQWPNVLSLIDLDLRSYD